VRRPAVVATVASLIGAALLLATVGTRPGPEDASPAAATTVASTATARNPAPTVVPTVTAGSAPASSGTPAADEWPAWTRAGRKYGVHLLLNDGVGHWPASVWPEHVAYARQLVGEGGYVVQLVRLDDLDPARWQFFLDLCDQQHVIPILRLATVYDRVNKFWESPPKDPDGTRYTKVAGRYRDLLARLRWPTERRYVIVGNEPNRGDEWSNRPSAAEYARFLTDVSAALRPIGVTVLGPSLDMYTPNTNGQLVAGYRYLDAETYIDEMAAAVPDVFSAIDVWSAHAYPLDAFRFDPSRQTFKIDYLNGASNARHAEPPAGIYNRGVNSYRWELWKVRQYIGARADSLSVMVTETGWRHASTQQFAARDLAQAELSDDRLATFVDLAYHGNRGRYPDLPDAGWTPWNDDPRVLGAVIFALGGYPLDWGHTNWVLVDRHGSITGVYPFFERMSLWTK
jgi:hypothetical protein